MGDNVQYMFPKSILKLEDYNKQNNEQKNIDYQTLTEKKIEILDQNIDHYQYPSTSSGSTYLVDSVPPFRQTLTLSQLQKKKVEFADKPANAFKDLTKKNHNKNIEKPIQNLGKISFNKLKEQYQQNQQQRIYDEELFLKLEQSFKVNFFLK